MGSIAEPKIGIKSLINVELPLGLVYFASELYGKYQIILKNKLDVTAQG